MELGEKAYDHLWLTYCELGKMELRFNNIQMRYRALASTWALAALAGIGFVIEKKPDILPVYLLVGLIGAFASVGLVLLWVVDLLHTQRLLDAVYIEGRSLETGQPWLPQVRNNMRTLLGGKGLRLVTLFYMISIVFMAAIGGLGLGLWLFKESFPYYVVLVESICYLVFLLFLALMVWHRSSTTIKLERQNNGENGLFEKRRRCYEAYSDIYVPAFENLPTTVSPNKGNSANV